MEEEEGGGSDGSQVLKDWEQIQQPASLLQPHLRWEVLETPNNLADDFSVFPPSNHEGLHMSLHQQQQEDQHGHHGGSNGNDNDDDEEDPHGLHQESSLSGVDSKGALRQLFESRLQVPGAVLMKRLRLGFEVLRSKIFRFASLLRSRRGANWALTTSTGVTAAFLTSLWYLRWRRWRQRLRHEKRDRLVLLLQEQNEKIGQLLDQVTRLNEILSAQRRVPVLRSS